MLSCGRHCNESPQKHSHQNHRYYALLRYHQMWLESNTAARAGDRALLPLSLLSSAYRWTEWAGRVGGAGLFKLHIYFSKINSVHFLSLFRGNSQRIVSTFSWCFEGKVRLNSIELGNLYLIVEFWTLCSLDIGQLPANKETWGFCGKGNNQCPYGLIWCPLTFFTHCMMKCMDFKNKMNPKKNSSKFTMYYSQHHT